MSTSCRTTTVGSPRALSIAIAKMTGTFSLVADGSGDIRRVEKDCRVAKRYNKV